MMGSPEDEIGRQANEGPQHQVTLTNDYYMQTTEVTQRQWEAVMGYRQSFFKDCLDCPVDSVSWNDIQLFINNLNWRGEGRYSLPTEAQWEYAARAGSTSALPNGAITEYNCGFDTNLDAIGWYCYNSNNKTNLVAQKTPNTFGLYDMHGNVWEWCQDFWLDYYEPWSVINPTGPATGRSRVLRGGSWDIEANHCRSARRSTVCSPDVRSNQIGFRLVRLAE